MKKQLLFLAAAAALTACPGELTDLKEVQPKQTVTVDGSALGEKYANKSFTLTYVDNFNDYDSFTEDWDIGNPGYEKREIGNFGYPEPEAVQFYVNGTNEDDGVFLGYKNDRYKQPYWSPKAVMLKDGFLVVGTMYDQNVSVYDKDGKKVRDGYPLAGAVHSRRQFPYGYFETRIVMSKETATQWNAWWAESNNPFSRVYGEKKLFTPTKDILTKLGLTDLANSYDSISKKTEEYAEQPRADVKWQGFNGQQVYEYDMYEWVEVASGLQWQAEHCWDWYGGYPGVEELKKGGNPPSSDQFGAVHDMKTIDGLRDNDGYGALGNSSIQPKLRAKDYFTLSFLWTPDGFIMWFDGDQRLVRKSDSGVKTWLENAQQQAKLAADSFNPIQIKYSNEIGQWNNDHEAFIKEFMPDGKKSIGPYDVMYVDYFAFYALNDPNDPDNPWYGGRKLADIKDTATATP